MNDKNKRKCKFCLKRTVCNEGSNVGITKQNLEIIILQLNLELHKDTAICNECAIKLQTASDFISTCLNAQQNILPFINSKENVKLNLKEGILKENMSVGLVEGVGDLRICRFCMKMTKKGCYTYLQEKKESMFMFDMVQNHFPNLSLDSTEQIVTCKMCLESLQNLLNFIMVCAGTEEKIAKSIEETDSKTENDVANDVIIPEVEEMNKQEENNTFVKNECDVKIENRELDIKEEDNESFQFFTPPLQKEHRLINSNGRSYKCSNCSYRTKLIRLLKKHVLIHQDLSEAKAYKCEKCLYVTNRKYYLKRHILTHRNPSEIKMYKCETCSYQTKHESSLTHHMLSHQKTQEIKIYNCEKCSFMSKYKRNLSQHLLTHKDLSEITAFKCEKCLYETNRKSQLKRHMLIHQDISEVKTYKCDSCSYVAKRKDCLRSHMFIHSLEPYKCEICAYETRHKQNFNLHMDKHKDPSKINIFKCGNCLFQTMRKGCLKTHLLTHQNSSETKLYNCQKCSFNTKHKVHFKQHILVHLDLSEITIYKCERCSYETNHEEDLNQHMLTHSEIIVVKSE